MYSKQPVNIITVNFNFQLFYPRTLFDHKSFDKTTLVHYTDSYAMFILLVWKKICIPKLQGSTFICLNFKLKYCSKVIFCLFKTILWICGSCATLFRLVLRPLILPNLNTQSTE